MPPDPVAFDIATAVGQRSDLPWLILGKGPSSGAYEETLTDHYNVIALNHAMRGKRAAIGHTLDIEVLSQLSARDVQGLDWLCLPWIPHIRVKRPLYRASAYFTPGAKTLADYASSLPLLADFLNRGRVLAYNYSTVPRVRRNPRLPSLDQSHSFSAAVVLDLLAQAGARTIRTLGVDGGVRYASAFADVEHRTKLKTAQTSFDSQFQEMAEILNRHTLLSGPLDCEVPAKVYVGCMPEQDLAYRVLKYSIKRHSSLSVEVQRLHEAVSDAGMHIPVPADPRNRGRTPFSFQRFAIPALRNYQGRALYLDSDMLVLKDLRPLWTFDMQGMQMLSAAPPSGSERRPQFSVMLIDCAELRWDVGSTVAALDAGQVSYEQLMHEMVSVDRRAAIIPETWNSLERYLPGETCLVHFTDMDSQPWLDPLHPHGSLWCGYLLDAVEAGAISRECVAAEVQRGHVRPSLLVQLDRREPDPRRLPLAVLRRDLAEFFPPHRQSTSRLSRWKHESYRAQALARHALNDGLLKPAVRRSRRIASSILSALTPR